MQQNLFDNDITPAEGETSVRTYYCTRYRSRLLGLKASGHLVVTNLRIIFHAQGTSNAGNSIIQSEVPIEYVSGISSYKGTYFSFGHLIYIFFVSLIAFMFVLIASESLVDEIGDAIILVTVVMLGVSFFIVRESIWRSILAATSTAPLVALINFFYRSFSGGIWVWVGVIALYALICFFWYSRRPTFTLSINSKGGSNKPINISGASGIGIFDVVAGRALNAEPVGQVEAMLKELGAVILDVQKLGDFGVEKWEIN